MQAGDTARNAHPQAPACQHAPRDQPPGSAVIPMEKATTANAFSLKAMALSTANLFALAQPGQSLYGIIAASPPSPDGANGDPAQFGTPSDPMTGKRMGGVIVFGG